MYMLTCSPYAGYALWEFDPRHLRVGDPYLERARVSCFLNTPIPKLSAY